MKQKVTIPWKRSKMCLSGHFDNDEDEKLLNAWVH